MIERRVDEYGRAIYGSGEVPPEDAAFAQWRGLTCSPDVCPSPDYSHKDLRCVGGWVPSGEWWLHCPHCRPHVLAAQRERHLQSQAALNAEYGWLR